MSRLGSSAARRRILAQISFALSSRTSDPSQMMRSLRSWSKMLLTSAGWAMRVGSVSGCRLPYESIRGVSATMALFAVGKVTRRGRLGPLLVVVAVVLVAGLATVRVATGRLGVALVESLKHFGGVVVWLDIVFGDEVGDVNGLALGVDD